MLRRLISSSFKAHCVITKYNIQCQRIHVSGALAAKIFMDTENRFAHAVLEHSFKPYQIFRFEPEQHIQANDLDITNGLEFILRPKATPDSITGAELIKYLTTFVQHLQKHEKDCISDARFKPFIELFSGATHKLSDDELLNALGLLTQIPEMESVKTPNYLELWYALDVECCSRIEKWDIDQLLKVCDAWYNLNLARINEFVKEAIKKFGRKVRKMRPEQLVQVMFLCNLTRKPVHEMFDFEENLSRCVEEMSLEELGVMSMGFFKTQTPLRNPELIVHLYQRLMAELDTVQDITLVAILKILRYSTKLKQADLALQLMEALLPQIGRLSLLSCLHIALLGSDMQCCNDEVLERILQRFSRDIEQTRLKDLERICFTIGVFNLKTPSGIENELCPKILPSLETRFDEIMKHPRCFVNCLHFLSLGGYYNKEMISSVLDKRFIHHAYGKNALLGREIFQLDSFVRINLKNEQYEGNLLEDKMRKTMGKILTHYIPERNNKYKLHLADRVLLDVKETVDRIIRENTLKHILPHFERPDIVFCYDRKKRKALPLSANCAEDYSGTILTREQLIDAPNPADIDTVVISIVGWNNVVREKDRFTGLYEMKLNQLKLLGHKSVLIYWYEWRPLETYTDRLNFLRRKLSTVIIL